MVFASNLIYSRHLHLFLRDMTYNADVKIFALSRSWKCLGCFLLNWFVVFSEQDGVHLGSKANKFLNGHSMGCVFHFSQHLFVSCAIQKMVSWVFWGVKVVHFPLFFRWKICKSVPISHFSSIDQLSNNRFINIILIRYAWVGSTVTLINRWGVTFSVAHQNNQFLLGNHAAVERGLLILTFSRADQIAKVTISMVGAHFIVA